MSGFIYLLIWPDDKIRKFSHVRPALEEGWKSTFGKFKHFILLSEMTQKEFQEKLSNV